MISEPLRWHSWTKAFAASSPLLLGIVLWSATKMNITLHPVPVENSASVTGVQLLSSTEIELLAGSVGKLTPVLDGFSPAQGLPGITLSGLPGATWDARRLPTGELAAVFTEPGSAVCWVLSKKSGAENETRLNSEAFSVYLQPRYVKGPAADPRVTAIQHKDGRAQVVLFPSDSRATNPRSVGEPSSSITDARLLRDSAGFWLFTLVRVPGEGAAAGPRQVNSGKRMPGVLHAYRFDGELKPAGNSFRVIAQPIYEFDVDSFPGNQVAVFATTPAGAIFARSELTDSPLPPEAWKETRFDRPLSSPSLMVRDGVAHCAALQDMGTPAARVLRGQIE